MQNSSRSCNVNLICVWSQFIKLFIIILVNLECFPIRVIAGSDKQIVGLVLAVAVTIHYSGMKQMQDDKKKID